jgi:uncharacterized protein
MRIHLPDISVLVALHDSTHHGHAVTDQWFASEGRFGWATCPLTQNGFVRVASQPSVPNMLATTQQAMKYLCDLIQDNRNVHHFWADTVSLFDTSLFSMNATLGRKQITDIYLLGLCQQNGGTFVTLDTRITTASIVNPHPDLLRTLTP